MREQVLCFSFVALFGLALEGCQDYPFEFRLGTRIFATKIDEIVANPVPTDILFVVDNSGSMKGEIEKLRDNIALFIEEMSKSTNDFQVGIITPDIECNLPGKDCAGETSQSCCNLNPTPCEDVAASVDDPTVVASTCDGGRLRASLAGTRIFARPEAANREAWVADFTSILDGLLLDLQEGRQGSGYEGGLEAARRAVACAAGINCDPRDRAVADLNTGFIRAAADLVIIFLTDEDDCSSADRSIYWRPLNPNDADEQADRFCSPDECYAYWGADLNADGDELGDWADPDSSTRPGANGLFKCGPSGNIPRLADPPALTPVDSFLDGIIAAKGGDALRVRAAGVLGGIVDPTLALGFGARGCRTGAVEPSMDCSCWGTTPIYMGQTTNVFCEVTQITQARGAPLWPENEGCSATPSGRYAQFLDLLSLRRTSAGGEPQTMADSICRDKYAQTITDIVNYIILNNCFELGLVPKGVENLSVLLNGRELPNIGLNCSAYDNIADCKAEHCVWDGVANAGMGRCVKSEEQGWSWTEGKSQICLENNLRKNMGDNFEIFVLTD